MKDFCEERVKSFGPRAAAASDDYKNLRFKDAEDQRMETKRGDLLTKLLENNTVLTTDEIFGDIFIFLVAGMYSLRSKDRFIPNATGHETTAHTLGWAVRLLATKPEIQEKVSICLCFCLLTWHLAVQGSM